MWAMPGAPPNSTPDNAPNRSRGWNKQSHTPNNNPNNNPAHNPNGEAGTLLRITPQTTIPTPLRIISPRGMADGITIQTAGLLIRIRMCQAKTLILQAVVDFPKSIWQRSGRLSESGRYARVQRARPKYRSPTGSEAQLSPRWQRP